MDLAYNCTLKFHKKCHFPRLWREQSKKFWPLFTSFHLQPLPPKFKTHAKNILRSLVCLCQQCIYIMIEIYLWSILEISAVWSCKCCFIVCDGVKNEIQGCAFVTENRSMTPIFWIMMQTAIRSCIKFRTLFRGLSMQLYSK